VPIRSVLLCAFTTALLAQIVVNAQGTIKPTLENRQSDFRHLYKEGVDDIAKNDYAAAILKFKAAIEANPNAAGAHINYGFLLISQGKYADAESELFKARALDSTIPEIYGNLGVIYQALGQDVLAIDNFRKYIEIDPKSPHLKRARNAIVMLQTDLALQIFHRIPNGENDYLGDVTEAGMARWPQNRQPITICIKSGNNVPSYRDAFKQFLMQSFTDWFDAAEGKVRFQYIDKTARAEIVCSWTNDPNELATPGECGCAKISFDENRVRHCDIVLLTTLPPDIPGKLSDSMAQRVALHEVGHALGLLTHSHNPDDIMFNIVRNGDIACGLSQRDKNTIVALYSLDLNMVAKLPRFRTKMTLKPIKTSK
jgi:predicted Zn-dependent protease